MKGAAPDAGRVNREEVDDPVEHLAGGFVRKGEEEDVARVDPVLEQIGDAIGEGARFARAGPGDDKQRPGWGGDGGVLLRVGLRCVIDADRGRGRSALEQIFAGHRGTTLRLGFGHFNEKFSRPGGVESAPLRAWQDTCFMCSGNYTRRSTPLFCL